MRPRRIALCGYMGVGKSTLADLIATRLAIHSNDLDKQIANQHGAIPDLFQNLGESGFRALETEQLAALCHTSGTMILALGGGAVLAPVNRFILADCGFSTVFLRAPLWLLWCRIGHGGDSRPLAGDINTFRLRYRQRLPIYRSLDTIVDCYPGSPDTIANRILNRLR